MSESHKPAPHITEMRSHLMDTLAALRDRENPMEPDRARAIAQVATVMVDSAKAEIDYIKATGAAGSGFIETHPSSLPLPHEGVTAHNPFPVSKRHRLEG